MIVAVGIASPFIDPCYPQININEKTITSNSIGFRVLVFLQERTQRSGKASSENVQGYI